MIRFDAFWSLDSCYNPDDTTTPHPANFMADCIDCGEPVYTKVEKDAEWKATMARCRAAAWLG